MLGRQRHTHRKQATQTCGEDSKETLAEGDQTWELEWGGGWEVHGDVRGEQAIRVLDPAAVKDGHSEESVVLWKDSLKNLRKQQVSY